MIKLIVCAVIVAAGLSGSTVAAARVTTISHSYEYELGPSNIPYLATNERVSHVFPAFDPTLGSLVGVAYEVVAHAELGVTWEADRAGLEVFGGLGQIGGEFRTWLAGYPDPSGSIGGAAILLPSAAEQIFYIYPAPKSGRRELRGRWATSEYVSVVDGGAEYFQGDALVVGEYSEYLGAYFDGGNMEVFDVTAKARHRLSVTYYYEDGTVPEPSGWALMIAGIGTVGAALRRRKLPQLQSARRC